MLQTVGIPVAYNHFDTPQECPFMCFPFGDDNDFIADGTNYQKIRTLSVELYTVNKDFTLEATVESVLNSHGLVYSRSENYLESERMQMVS